MTHTKDEALKLAKAWFEHNTYGDEAVEVYEAIEQALAAPVQEPVMEYPDYTPGVGWRNVTPPAAPVVQEPDHLREFKKDMLRREHAAQPAPVREDWGPGPHEYHSLPSQPAPVQPVACFIGAKGSAFDLPETKRAYTYKEQPGNAVASKLGRACEAANKQRAGDNIDRGLGLLQELQKEGFGVFDLGAEYTAAQPAVPDAIGPNEDELPAYAAGWNDCRAEMLKGMK